MALLDKLKETAQKGADLAREGVKAGQEKIETAKIERRIGELKAELGGVVYAQRSGQPAENADAEIERIVGEIRAAEGELDKARADDGEAEGGTASA